MKGHNSKYNLDFCYSVFLCKPFWAPADMDWSHANNGLWLPHVWQDSNFTQPETGDLMLLLAKWKGMGYVFKLILFTHKTVDSAPYNCEFDHGSQLTSHFFRLLGYIHLLEYEVFQTLLFVSPKSSLVGKTLCMCPCPTFCTTDLVTSLHWGGPVSELEGRILSQKNRKFIKTGGHIVVHISSGMQGKQKSAEV